MKQLFTILIVCTFFACNNPHYSEPHVIITTRLGDIELELYAGKAPKTVAAFLSYVDKGIYKNSAFYRVLKSEDMPTDYNTGIIQGGIYPSSNASVTPLVHESTQETGLSHLSGTVSFARLDGGSASSEFFICIGDQLTLDAGASGTSDGKGYAVFGKVFKGMSVVRKIQNQKKPRG